MLITIQPIDSQEEESRLYVALMFLAVALVQSVVEVRALAKEHGALWRELCIFILAQLDMTGSARAFLYCQCGYNWSLVDFYVIDSFLFT